MGLLLSIIVGGAVGWTVSLVMKTDSEQQSIVFYIVVGIAGSVILGSIMSILVKSGVSGFNFFSLVVALIGAIVLIFVAKRYGGYEYFKKKF